MNRIMNLYNILHNTKTRLLIWPKMRLFAPEVIKLISKNEILKNKYKGKRCFILGNGPSLKDVDLSLLREEYTFSVNQLSRNTQFNELKTNFHFWADPIFFNIDSQNAEDMELLQIMKNVKTEDNNPLVFLPVEQRSFACENGLEKIFDIYYFLSGYSFNKYFRNINYKKIVPSFGTVVQWCITMAVYMGFSEIYLLGCDNSGLINNINSAMHNDVTDYAYALSSNEQKRLEKISTGKKLYEYAMTYATSLIDYENLFCYCKRKSVVLRNCTHHSAIDTIPYIDLNVVLKEG